jgi:hypothetical protein
MNNKRADTEEMQIMKKWDIRERKIMNKRNVKVGGKMKKM